MKVISSAALLSLAVTLLPVAQANSLSPNETWFVGAGGGASWLGLRSLTTVYNGSLTPPPTNQDTFTTHPDNAGAIGQLYVGYRWYKPCQIISYYNASVQYRHYWNENIEGRITQYSTPGFTNYNYQIGYESDLFTLNGKIDFYDNQVMPYLSGGLGFILNHINNYSETPTAGVVPRISPNYNGRTKSNLALTLGAGIDYVATENIWLTLGYDHVFQGSVRSGHGTTTWSTTNLRFGKLNMDTVFLNVTANFPQSFTR